MNSSREVSIVTRQSKSYTAADGITTPPSSPKIESPSNLGRQLGHQIVTITVGSGADAKVFALHRALLCEKVLYFKNMFSSGFAESFTHTAELLEVGPAVFELFVTWLYVDAIQLPEDIDAAVAFELLIILYAFAEERVITKLCDQTMDKITQFMAAHEVDLTPSQVKLAYEFTPLYSPIRKFMASMCVHIILGYPEDSSGNSWNAVDMLAAFKDHDDLLADIFIGMRGRAGKVAKDPLKASDCDYHFHALDEDCPYEKKSSASTPSKKRGLKKPVTPPSKRRTQVVGRFGRGG